MKSLGHRSHWKFLSALMPLLWLRWWNSKFPFNGNDLPHSSHAYGRSPVWHRLKRTCKLFYNRHDWIPTEFCIMPTNLIWLIRCSLRVNGLLHTVHTCGLSPEWCRKWLVKCSFRVNVLAQNSHLCGEMPVCIITWLLRCSLRVKTLLQYSHLWGESPVCLRVWLVKCSFRVNVFVQ